jgi:hypothetical protein
VADLTKIKGLADPREDLAFALFSILWNFVRVCAASILVFSCWYSWLRESYKEMVESEVILGDVAQDELGFYHAKPSL